MKRSKLLALLPLALSLSLVSCEERLEVQNVRQLSVTPAETTEAKAQSYTWPPPSDEQVSNVLQENYFVIMDDSGSMSGRRINEARQALLNLAQTLPAEHNLGVMFLNDPDVVSLSSGDRREFVQRVKTVNAYGGTPLLNTIVEAYRKITEQASSQSGYGSYHLIVVTDGNSTDGSPLQLVRSIVANTSIQVHVIGFHVNDHILNDPAFIDYQTASNSTELAKAFESVTAETDTFSDPTEFTQ